MTANSWLTVYLQLSNMKNLSKDNGDKFLLPDFSTQVFMEVAQVSVFYFSFENGFFIMICSPLGNGHSGNTNSYRWMLPSNGMPDEEYLFIFTLQLPSEMYMRASYVLV